MAHVSLENLNLRNLFFVYCIIRKLHYKIMTDYTMLMGLCKKHQDKYGFDTLSSCLTGGHRRTALRRGGRQPPPPGFRLFRQTPIIKKRFSGNFFRQTGAPPPKSDRARTPMLVGHGKFGLLMNKKSLYLGYIYV